MLGTYSHTNITALENNESHLNLRENPSESFVDQDATNIQSQTTLIGNPRVQRNQQQKMVASTSIPNDGKNIADNGGTGGLPDQGMLSLSPSDVKGQPRLE